MKLYRSALLLLGETAAFGWFMLRDLSFLTVIPLIPIGIVCCFLPKWEPRSLRWLNAPFALAAVLIAAEVTGQGLFAGKGWISLICLLIAAGLFACGLQREELRRVSGWWAFGFACVFIVMLLATLPGVRLREELPPFGTWRDIIIFYVLALLEPLSLGKDYRGAPLALGILLLPFGLAAYLALGSGAFQMAEYPYLSVWSGAAVFSFHHTEAIILGLYYGLAAFRAAHFFVEIGNTGCKQKSVVL